MLNSSKPNIYKNCINQNQILFETKTKTNKFKVKTMAYTEVRYRGTIIK